ncbi:MAG TPA: hypothetical protein PK535_12110 [Synergistaceae bacterium]|nr:hypothetical protein [Synergistaceae bacterium]
MTCTVSGGVPLPTATPAPQPTATPRPTLRPTPGGSSGGGGCFAAETPWTLLLLLPLLGAVVGK